MTAGEIILAEVEQRRAASFTALKKSTGLENGTLQHYIEKLDDIERRKQAVVHREGCRSCPLKDSCEKECLIALLENKTRRRILEMKMEGNPNSEIADRIGVHRSTVTYHLSKLPELDSEFLMKIKKFL